MKENVNEKEKMRVLSLDLPVIVLEEVDAAQLRQRQRGVVLRMLLRNELNNYYNFKTCKKKTDIVMGPALCEGKLRRIGLPIPETDILALDNLCKGLPVTRKSLAEYFIVCGYQKGIPEIVGET